MCPNLTDSIPRRVLVVDDEEAVLKVVKTILNRARYEVVTCETAEEGLRLLNSQAFDCLITDAIMPAMNGYDLVKKIRSEQFGEIPILMLARKRNRQDVKKAVEAGITDYVLKPVDEHLLLDKVEVCIRKGTGKRHIVECAIHNPLHSKAELGLQCLITALSESYITIRLSMPIPAQSEFEMRAPLYDEIGIPTPLIKLISCQEAAGSLDTKGLAYEAKFSFIGVPEPDLRKIRIWINREEIRRRK